MMNGHCETALKHAGGHQSIQRSRLRLKANHQTAHSLLQRISQFRDPTIQKALAARH
jgi:hypothetical protein